jgi:hypothetical protein
MRTLVIGLAVAAVIFFATGGHLIFLPLLFIPVGFLAFRRGRQRPAALRSRPLSTRRSPG